MKRILIAAGFAAAAALAGAQLLDSTIATVNLEEFVPITERMVRPEIERRERQVGRQLTVTERRAVVDEFVDDELLTQAARAAGFAVSRAEVDALFERERASLGQGVTQAQYRSFIQQQTGLAWELYRAEVEKRLLQEQYIVAEAGDLLRDIDEPTDRDVRRFYEENAVEFVRPAMVRFDHLFFDTRGRPSNEQVSIRQRANALGGDIRSGRESFDQAVSRALDDVSIAGGDFGYLILTDPVAREQLGTAFIESVFFDLERGEVSTVLSSSLGYHIVRITDRRPPTLLGLSNPVMPGESITVRQEIENALIAQQQQVAFQRAARRSVTRLRETAEITVNADSLRW